MNILLSHPNISVIQLPASLITGNIDLARRGSGSRRPPKLALRVLDLSICRYLSDAGLARLLRLTDGQSLRELTLSHSFLLFTGLSAKIGRTRLIGLETLCLNCCFKMTDVGLVSVLNNVGGECLRNLDLRGTNISLANAETMLGAHVGFPVLEELHLSFCSKLTDAGLLAILGRIGPRLKRLQLGRTNLTLANMNRLEEEIRFPLLEGLGLLECSNLVEAGVWALLARTGESLAELSITQRNFAESIKKRMPRLMVHRFS